MSMFSLLELKRLQSIPLNDNTCEKAVKIGDLNLLMWTHENDCEWNEWTCARAAENGHLDCLIYAHEQTLMSGQARTLVSGEITLVVNGMLVLACGQPKMDNWNV